MTHYMKLDPIPFMQIRMGMKTIELRLWDEKRSMIVVTHEMGFAREAAHRISFMEGGKFIETSNPYDFFNNPRSESLARFIKQIQTV